MWQRTVVQTARTSEWARAGLVVLVTLVADHWQYCAMIGIVALVVGVGTRVMDRFFLARSERITAAAVVVVLCWLTRPWWCAGVVLLATVPPWWHVWTVRREARQVAADPVRGPHGTTMVMETVSACLGDDGQRTVVLAVWDQGAVLAGLGAVRVVGSGYWSNLEGLTVTHELFSTRRLERFWELVGEREIEYFVVPPPALLAEAIGDSTYVMTGTQPTVDEIKQTVVWQVASRGNFPLVECEPMQRIAPQGFILDLRRRL